MSTQDPSRPARRRSHLPAPPPASQRREPLPEHMPKPAEEDPEAPRRLEAILASPSYRQADADPDFLNRKVNRGVRLQVEYLKPELTLREHQIEHTIVVFGSTRIPEPEAAARRLAVLREYAASEPDNDEAQRAVAVAERLREKSRYYEVAREFGRLVGAAGKSTSDGDLVVMTGGGPGLMEAANRGAHDVAAKSVGLNIGLPQEQFPNPYITPELCFRFHYFALRKMHFLLRAKALVAFPGGLGTLDELFETLTLVQTRKIAPLPVVLVGESFWRRIIDFDFMAEEGVIDPEDQDLFWYAETASEIWEGIHQWHRLNGTPLPWGAEEA
jgi:uncharacterized protein (TIGR00730 family)